MVDMFESFTDIFYTLPLVIYLLKGRRNNGICCVNSISFVDSTQGKDRTESDVGFLVMASVKLLHFQLFGQF